MLATVPTSVSKEFVRAKTPFHVTMETRVLRTVVPLQKDAFLRPVQALVMTETPVHQKTHDPVASA